MPCAANTSSFLPRIDMNVQETSPFHEIFGRILSLEFLTSSRRLIPLKIRFRWLTREYDVFWPFCAIWVAAKYFTSRLKKSCRASAFSPSLYTVASKAAYSLPPMIDLSFLAEQKLIPSTPVEKQAALASHTAMSKTRQRKQLQFNKCH